jgi:hypothetical protein
MSDDAGPVLASAADERLRALSEAASPGKWFTDPADEPGRVSAVTVMEPVARTVARATSYGRKEADAEFIAAAVNHLRAALARSAAADGPTAQTDGVRAARLHELTPSGGPAPKHAPWCWCQRYLAAEPDPGGDQ